MRNKHLISIVGAGPGDPDLLTIRAQKRLMEADIVFYDALHGAGVLNIAPQKAKLIFVGKLQCDGQDQTKRQNNIHRLMLDFAQKGKRVVRLKTGDPMVFGRGAEEIRFCKTNGLKYEVIPGITAAVAGSALLEIPVTEREKSSMVLFYTGQRVHGTLSNVESVAEVLRGGGSVCMYMGFKSITLLAKSVIKNGIDGNIPVHMVSQVSQKGQSVFSSCLSGIETDLNTNQLKTPVLFIMGQYTNPI
jgi:uroporphyrin-III C-methyltransferase